MKIFILFEFHDGPYGGGNQFLKNLKKEFQRKKIYEEQIENADVILFNSFQNLLKVIFSYIQYPNKIWIHRVDGPISKYRGSDLYIDKIIYEINNVIADGTVFQSCWSQEANHLLGMREKKYEVVIKNACNSEIFNEKDKSKYKSEGKIKLVASSWSSNWNKGFEYCKFLDGNLDFHKYEMTFIGNSPIKFKNIRIIPSMPSDELALQLKKHDIYVTASKNDPCSNSLIEALSCGLPAVCLKSGGHPEIVGKNGELFKNKQEMIEKINKIVRSYKSYQSITDRGSFSETSNSYLDFAGGLLKTSSRSSSNQILKIIMVVTKVSMILIKQKIIQTVKKL